MACILCTGLETPGIYRPHRPCQVFNSGPCDACVQIKQLESQILDAQRSLNNLTEKHRELRTKMNRHHDPIVLKAPSEIASTIFEFCFDPLESLHVLALRHQADNASRLNLAAVCRGWRRIAESTPRIWTALAVPFNSRSPFAPQIIDTWLSRSGSLPLALSLFLIRYDGRTTRSDSYPLCTAILDVLSKSSARWQALEMDSIPGIWYPFFCRNTSSTPVLRSLVITNEEDDTSTGHFSLLNVAPRPEEVMLHRQRLSLVSIDWANVTSVDFRGMHVHECHEVLRQAPRLQKFSLELLVDEEEVAPITTIELVIHPYLEEPQIDNYASISLATFLNGVSFPGLVNFTIGDDALHLDFDVLSSFLRRSACQLRQLEMQGMSYGSSDIVTFLEHTPSLESLTLSPLSDSEHFPDELFERLAITTPVAENQDDEQAIHFLPRLRSFSYHAGQKYSLFTTNQKFPWHILGDIFGPSSEFKNPRRRPLQQVTISFDQWQTDDVPLAIDEEYIPSLVSVLRAGLKLDIYYRGMLLDLMDPVYNL